jgi:hypothetical protein
VKALSPILVLLILAWAPPAGAAATPPAEAGAVALARSQYAAAAASGSMKDACAAATVVAGWASRHSDESGVEHQYWQWEARRVSTCDAVRRGAK